MSDVCEKFGEKYSHVKEIGIIEVMNVRVFKLLLFTVVR